MGPFRGSIWRPELRVAKEGELGAGSPLRWAKCGTIELECCARLPTLEVNRERRLSLARHSLPRLSVGLSVCLLKAVATQQVPRRMPFHAH